MNKSTFDIAIIGAGPAGCSAALTLRNSNCSVALFEKTSFPRNKICGDGICDRSINTLKAINPAYFEEFLATQKYLCIRNVEIGYKKRFYPVNVKSYGYICRRLDFDNFLFNLVQREAKNVTVFQNCGICKVERTGEGLKLCAKNGEMYFTKMLLVCNGASSKIARELTGSKPDKSTLGVAVRAYYSSVKGVKDNIRSIFETWIANDDVLRHRFSEAKSITPLVGGLIPYNVDKYDCFGDNFFVCGDAANLIDPVTAGGIGNAMVSRNIQKCSANASDAISTLVLC